MPMSEEQKKSVVDDLVSNECCWTEEDREVLMNLSDGSLQREQARIEKEANEVLVANAARVGFEDPNGHTHVFNEEEAAWETTPPETILENRGNEDPPVDNTPKEPLTDEEWMAQASPNVRAAVQNAMQITQREKDELIQRLTANLEGADKTKVFDRMKDKELDELRDLVLLAPEAAKPTANYFGASTPTAPATNKQDEPDEELPMPVMAFDKE